MLCVRMIAWGERGGPSGRIGLQDSQLKILNPVRAVGWGFGVRPVLVGLPSGEASEKSREGVNFCSGPLTAERRGRR